MNVTNTLQRSKVSIHDAWKEMPAAPAPFRAVQASKNEAKKCLPRLRHSRLSTTPMLTGTVIDAWLSGLRDRGQWHGWRADERLELGLLGDCRSVKGGVMELRIDYGPGYRVYFAPIQQHVILLLGGGTKGTQQADIAEAQALAVKTVTH